MKPLEEIRTALETVLRDKHWPSVSFAVDPASVTLADVASNLALVLGKELGRNPREVGEEILQSMAMPPECARAEVAGAGFLNFYFSRGFFRDSVARVLQDGVDYGRAVPRGETATVEYTDPNPFKEFHIGHLMSNAVGEALAGLLSWEGYEVKRANYQGDVGLHVACALWGMQKLRQELPLSSAPLAERAAFLGRAYAAGATANKEDPAAGEEIRALNKKIYERSEEEVNRLYDLGRTWSLDYFETIYRRLGTSFDFYFFESEVGPVGARLVREGLARGVFEESEGAVVFRGERHGLHTRVFLTKEGLPTYEAKELGLETEKQRRWPHDNMVIVTGNEIAEYFKVVLAALRELAPELAAKVKHTPHGMLRLPSGKMSSRTGHVITSQDLLAQVGEMVKTKMNAAEFTEDERDQIADQVAVAALKLSILRQAIGKDVIFDIEKSVSLEGDSGPYLQYTAVRAHSLLKKAQAAGLLPSATHPTQEAPLVERLMWRFPAVLSRAAREYAPQHVVSYLLEFAGAFNSFYNETKIIDSDDEAAYRAALVRAAGVVIENGLTVLGIRVPERM